MGPPLAIPCAAGCCPTGRCCGRLPSLASLGLAFAAERRYVSEIERWHAPRTFQNGRLAAALATLAKECGAQNAHVLDAWANLWCSADAYDGPGGDLAIGLTDAQLKKLRLPLNRGGRLHCATATDYFRSFAGIYVVNLHFAGPFDADAVLTATDAALPRIEALTLLLPPPEGPGSGGAEGFGVA